MTATETSDRKWLRYDRLVATGGLVLLCAGAAVGNRFGVPLYFGSEIVFGSIAVVMAAALFGPIAGALVGGVGAVFAADAVGVPVVAAVLAAEGFAVGLLVRRFRGPVVLSDLAFWLAVGVPVLAVAYRWQIELDWWTVLLLASKSVLNAAFNALIAALALQVLIFTGPLARALRVPRPSMRDVIFHSVLVGALLAGAVPLVETARIDRLQTESDVAERLSREARVVAERLARIEAPPEAAARTAVRILDLGDQGGVAVLSTDGTVLARRGKLMTLDAADGGARHPIRGNVAAWLAEPDAPAVKRWQRARYVATHLVAGVPGVAIVTVERAAAPVVEAIVAQRSRLFFLATDLFLFALVIAVLLSRWLAAPLVRLQRASATIPERIETGETPVLPETTVAEYAALSATLSGMAGDLAESFRELRVLKDGLEEQVAERTASLSRFRATLDRTRDGVLILDPATYKLQYVNEGAAAQFHRPRAALIGGRLDALLDAEAAAILRDALETTAVGAEPAVMETDLPRAEGEALPVEIVLQRIAPEGESERVVAVLRDISERRRAEARLRDQAEHMQVLVDNMADGVVSIDRTGRIVSFNKAAERLFGYRAVEAIGRDVGLLMREADARAHGGHLARYHETGVAQAIGIGREVVGRHRDGTPFPVDIAISEITRDGEPHYVAVMRDISERVRTERSAGAVSVADRPSMEPAAPTVSDLATESHADTRGRILIAERDPRTADTLRSVVHGLRYRPVTVDMGADALDMLSEGHFTAMLLADRLPDMNGFQVIRKTRGSLRQTDLPIIVVASRNQHARLPGGIEAGPIAWHGKPVDPAGLAALLADQIAGRVYRQPEVLLVEVDEARRDHLADRLGTRFNVTQAADSAQARAHIGLERFDVVLVAAETAGGALADLAADIALRQPEARLAVLAAETACAEIAAAVPMAETLSPEVLTAERLESLLNA